VQNQSNDVNSKELLDSLYAAKTTVAVETILSSLPIVDYEEYQWESSSPEAWKTGWLHWVPVGLDRGNAGRIQLAGEPYNPLAERLVNGMEAIIEHARQQELLSNPNASIPQSPREAVERYFDIPRLDLIPRISDKERRRQLGDRLQELRGRLCIRLDFDKGSNEFSVEISDRGIGQAPANVHKTLLSLGRTDKADKPYMVGVFGQGGSSTYYASICSIVLSRRASPFFQGAEDGLGWTVVRKISPENRRDPFYAYLAVDRDGTVPMFPKQLVDQLSTPHGVMFRHIGYDFGRGGSGIARTLYPALNHVLFNPVLPYDLYALGSIADAMHGNAYRLSRKITQLEAKRASVLDKSFPYQSLDVDAQER
jgi:hypothetical protein